MNEWCRPGFSRWILNQITLSSLGDTGEVVWRMPVFLVTLLAKAVGSQVESQSGLHGKYRPTWMIEMLSHKKKYKNCTKKSRTV